MQDLKQISRPERHASRMGLILGAYMSLGAMLLTFSLNAPFLNILYLFLFLGTPFVAYGLGRRYRDLFPQEVPFPFILSWSHGVQMFCFAGIILMIPMYFFFAHSLPNQVPVIQEILNTAYRQDPNLKEIMRQLYGTDPMEVIYQIASREALWGNLWMVFSRTIFLGAIISLVNALILKRKAK